MSLASTWSVSFVTLDGADHLLIRAADATYAANLAAAWAERHVNDSPPVEARERGRKVLMRAGRTGLERRPVCLRSRNRGFAAHRRVAPRSLGETQLPPHALRCLQLHDFARSGKPVGALAQEVLAGGHRMLSDEPPAQGGTDAGPTPHALLQSSLGACTSMTMYADRKQWSLEGVEVRLRHERIHAEDCADYVVTRLAS